jgi:hypothetical protein
MKIQNQLDTRWYDIYQEIGSFQPYTYLTGHASSREEQKALFLSGKIHNPHFEYPFLDRDLYLVLQAKLIALHDRINSEEENELVTRAYGWKIEEKLNELELLLAVCDKDMHAFKRHTEAVYGAPKLDVFEFTIHSLKLLIEEHLASTNAITKNAAVELEQMLGEYMPQYKNEITQYQLPSQKALSTARRQTFAELGSLIQGIGTHKKVYDAHDIQKLFSVVLNRLGIDAWKATIDQTSSSAINVHHEIREVQIPSTRTMNHEKLLGIILHEIGTHVARRVQGEQSPLALLGLGLNGYERTEEGIATMREQVLDDEIFEYARGERHLAISLCYGLDGQKRDFRAVYTLLQKYLFFKSVILGNAIEQAKESSVDLAWITTERAFRGTDCATAGICFTKDIIYQEGNIAIWSLIEENPAEMLRFNAGRYDPTNPLHRELLQDLGIIVYQ